MPSVADIVDTWMLHINEELTCPPVALPLCLSAHLSLTLSRSDYLCLCFVPSLVRGVCTIFQWVRTSGQCRLEVQQVIGTVRLRDSRRTKKAIKERHRSPQTQSLNGPKPYGLFPEAFTTKLTVAARKFAGAASPPVSGRQHAEFLSFHRLRLGICFRKWGIIFAGLRCFVPVCLYSTILEPAPNALARAPNS